VKISAYLLQHLLRGPMAIGDLARPLSISQQAVSRSALELESGGYLQRRSVDGDRRSRSELAEALGEQDVNTARQVLQGLLRHIGAAGMIAARSVPAP